MVVPKSLFFKQAASYSWQGYMPLAPVIVLKKNGGDRWLSAMRNVGWPSESQRLDQWGVGVGGYGSLDKRLA